MIKLAKNGIIKNYKERGKRYNYIKMDGYEILLLLKKDMNSELRERNLELSEGNLELQANK